MPSSGNCRIHSVRTQSWKSGVMKENADRSMRSRTAMFYVTILDGVYILYD